MTYEHSVSFNTGEYGNENLILQETYLKENDEPSIKMKIEFYCKKYENNQYNKKYGECFMNKKEAETFLKIIENEKGEIEINNNIKISVMPDNIKETYTSKPIQIIPGLLISIKRFDSGYVYSAITTCNMATIDMIYFYISTWIENLQNATEESE